MAAQTNFREGRRNFILQGGILAGAAALLGTAPLLAAEKKEVAAVEVTPTEDLMQEHGVLRRLMLIFDEIQGRLLGSADFPPDPLIQAIKLVRRFIQDYHEKDEEEYLFPRFEKAGKLTDLVKFLYAQHQAGRKLLTDIEDRANAANLKKLEGRQNITGLLGSFNRMYRPHAAREDTVLYPAFRSLITPKEFIDLGDKFENKEQELFGKDGFEKIVAAVAGLEKQLGLSDLAQFSPKV